MNAFVIDAFEFCRLKERREGEIAVADLTRLAGELVDKSSVLRWALQGGSNMHGHPQLLLSVSGVVRLMCQRCLTSVDFNVASDSTLILAADEDSADEIDALLADEVVEVIVGSRNFDMAQVIEDDVLLAMPLSPRHEVCPGQVTLEASKDEKVSPFAVLKNLKR